MECNKDEAIRALEIATRKFSDKDYAGAKRFALKAQSLYPSVEGIEQMIKNVDVHISAERKAQGELDWYTILGVPPLADGATIKKLYKKSALSYHPDKNKSVGADSAFKIISQGFSILMDRDQRLAYDRKMNMQHLVQPYAQCQRGSVPVGPATNNQTSSSNVFQSGSKPQQRVPSQSDPSMRSYWNPQHPGSAQREAFGAPGYSSWENLQAMRGAQHRSNNAGGAYRKPISEPAASAPASSHGATSSGQRPQNESRASSSKGTGRQSRARAPIQGEGTAAQSNSKEIPSFGSQYIHETDCFWTRCKGCKNSFEYPKRFLNQFLLCRECRTGFEAVEVGVPSSFTNRVVPCPRKSRSSVDDMLASFYNYMAAESTNVSQPAKEKAKRGRGANNDGGSPKKQRVFDLHDSVRNPGAEVATKSSESGKIKGSTGELAGNDSDSLPKLNSSIDYSLFELQTSDTDKATGVVTYRLHPRKGD